MVHPGRILSPRFRSSVAIRVVGMLPIALLLLPIGAEEPQGEVKKANRLAKETSPYLLQHAHNPVDWYPWGPEALQKAKQENKLIFLSIGYSSCHWCHVMERESFMDEEIATAMNENFICIKVDREERPDIDAIYMRGLQTFYRLAGAEQAGGWPLSMFLTPDGEPFFGGTYFPPRDGDRGAATGFLTILKRVNQIWKEKEEVIRRDAQTITTYLKKDLESPLLPLGKQIDEHLLDDIYASIKGQFDPQHGGFGFDPDNDQQPKFPEPANLLFLIERIRTGADQGPGSEPTAHTMLVETLDHMARGGIYDHIGGGFHRYSVDRFWSIPHFEKMLYDNGQLISVYAEAYALTKRDDFRRIVEESIQFVQRELRDPNAGFYSALDADSEGEEGKFYRWRGDELRTIVDKEEWQPFASVYQLDGAPNFERQFYVPQLERPWAQEANDLQMEEPELVAELKPIRAKLFEHRSQRVRPNTDTKILTGWNGLMIRGLADAGRLLENPEYIELATQCGDFLLTEMRTEDGRLRCTYSQGEARLNGYLNDYAFLIDGLLSLHRATGNVKWLDAAQQLMEKQIDLFWDETANGFFFTSDDHETLLARTKEFFDTSTPSGNSVSATNLLYLAEHLQRDDYREKAEETMRAALPYLERAPAAAPWMAIAISRSLEK